MDIPLFLLLISGALNVVLGVKWNFDRQRMTGVYSEKYKAICIIGIAEIALSIALFASVFFDYQTQQ